MENDRPIPEPNSDTKPFWDGCKKHQLLLQRCSNCRHFRWPASFICPKCHSFDSEWIVSRGKGKIYSFAIYHVAFDQAVKHDIPYVTAIVELVEGPKILTNIVECGSSDVRCDMSVEVVWDDIADNFALPRFRPIIS
ncbi:MAG TPA: OB-fold domain-containing protein [Desulfatiglandales bacterium]|nr:OB-fold domain-containing protein [Desulfatiglandales bacterium]